MSAPTFTVAIPCYRSDLTVAESVRSVIRQTCSDFEVFLVDDGCPLATGRVALQAANGDRRVRLIETENKGPSSARNTGMMAGTGTFVAFLDADDTWEDRTLDMHLRHFQEEPEVGVSFGITRFYDSELMNPGRCSVYVRRPSLLAIMGENPACTASNIVARRAVFQHLRGFAEDLHHAEDQELIARVVADGRWAVGGLNAITVNYRTSLAGLSENTVAMRKGWDDMVSLVRGQSPAAVREIEGAAEALFERYAARRTLRLGQSPRKAARHFMSALTASPAALFQNQPRRTLLTAAGILAALLFPSSWVQPHLSR